VKSIAGAIGFFTTFPIGRDARSFEALRRNLFILPVAGLFAGVVIGALSYLFASVGVGFLAILAVLAVEGINHVDGLADLGDAMFVENARKKEVLKDTKTGVGGCILICLYLLTIAFSAERMGAFQLFLALITLEVSAKFAMLLLLSTSKPLWDGLAKTIMEFADRKQAFAGFIISTAILIPVQQFFPAIQIFLFSIALVLVYRAYVIRAFGGINGDITGALNCIVIAVGACACSLC